MYALCLTCQGVHNPYFVCKSFICNVCSLTVPLSWERHIESEQHELALAALWERNQAGEEEDDSV